MTSGFRRPDGNKAAGGHGEPEEDDVRYREQVNRGAKALDEINPGWANRISLKTLAMETCDSCVLGQVYGDYEHGCHEAYRSNVWPRGWLASEMGFTLLTELQDLYQDPEDVILERFRELADDWREAIQERIRDNR